MLKILFSSIQDDPQTVGKVYLKWAGATPEGKDFTVFLRSIGRRPVERNLLRRQGGKSVGITDKIIEQAKFDQIQAAGVQKDSDHLIEFVECLPGGIDGKRFQSSYESLEKTFSDENHRLATDKKWAGDELDRMATDKKQAGDELDRLAREVAAREGLTYSVAFERARQAHPEIYRRYCA
ncbi:MAG: hypothetical protein ABH891_00035 [Candidatus Omnitrophota bacterium]